MKILLVLPTLEIGGTETQTLALARSLKLNGYSPTICCLYKSASLLDEVHKARVNFICLNAKSPYDMTITSRLYKTIKSEKYPIVQTFLFDANIWGPPIAKMAGAKLIISCRRNYDDWMKLRHVSMQRFSNQFTNLIISNSQSVRQFAMSKEGISPSKAKVIYNGLDINGFDKKLNAVKPEKIKHQLGIGEDSKVVTIIANLKPSKGLHYFLEAASIIAKNEFKVRFLIIGDGLLKSDLNKLAHKLGVHKYIKFCGLRRDIPEILSCTDVSVNSSIREGMANSILESMAAKIPVVATDVGGNAEAITNGLNGFIVPSKDINALASKIVELLQDSRLSRKMGAAGRKKVEEIFSLKKMTDSHENLYKNIV